MITLIAFSVGFITGAGFALYQVSWRARISKHYTISRRKGRK